MKRKTPLITIALIVVILANVALFVGLRYWRAHKQEEARIMLRDATRYAGATGGIVTRFDEITNRWLDELKAETIEESLSKLTDAAEYEMGFISASDGINIIIDEEWRERSFYRMVIEGVLSNRRFRKAYEDLQKTNKKQAAVLLSKHIRDNLAELRTMLQEDVDKVSQGGHQDTDEVVGVLFSTYLEGAYRPMGDPDKPPTRTGRKYAVFSYLLLASLLELQEVRPAVEKVIEFAREEYKLFNSMGEEAGAFKVILLKQSLYNPSLLVTASFCDPSWKAAEKKKISQEKCVEREVVDYQARAIEHDDLAGKGLVPIVPHNGMLKIRYHKGITDKEFNDFFGE